MKDKVGEYSFAIVGHSVYPGVAGALRRYLLEHEARELTYITHEFSTLKTRRSYIERYVSGLPSYRHFSADFRFLPEPLLAIKDFLYTIAWVLFKAGKVDVYFGLSGADTACGVFLKWTRRVKKVVFYSIDFIPARYRNRLLNEAYHRTNEFALRHSDETWNLSPRMAEGRERIRGLSEAEYLSQFFVPMGIWPDSKVPNFNEINKHEIVFIGELSEKVGVQLVLQAMPLMLQEVPDLLFRVIGTGAHEDRLKQLARQIGVQSSVVFEGLLLDHELTWEKLSKAALAMAPYDRSKDDFTYYADPGKLKWYLMAGLPIILTDLPYNASEIEERGCGRVVEYHPDALARAVTEIMKDERLLEEMRRNVASYAKTLDWNIILDSNLKRII